VRTQIYTTGSVCFDCAMEIVRFGALTDDDRAQLEGDEPDPFDAAGITLAFRPKDEHIGVRDDAGRLVASAGFVLAEVKVEGTERFDVFGIGGVIVAAAHRGQGLARTVVAEALAEGARRGCDYALLFCHEDRSGLYRKLDFSVLDSRLTVRQPSGTAVLPQLAMWRRLTATREWPPGAAELQSLPF
jgi:ribosomal protein S18 acetylase RimI-like enzyme